MLLGAASLQDPCLPRGYNGIMEKNMEATIVFWGYNGIMEKKMEATIVFWGYNGMMEKKMETTIVFWGYHGIMEIVALDAQPGRFLSLGMMLKRRFNRRLRDEP